MFDDLSTQRYCSLFDLPYRVNFIEGDIRHKDHIALICHEQDVVIHLAAITDAATSHERPKEVQSVNVGGTRNVIEACLLNGCKLIFQSTTSVYGQAEGVVTEESEVNPQSVYAESKATCEGMIEAYRSEGLKAIILRFGTIHGVSPGMRFHTAVNKFCWEAAMGLPLTIWETAYNQRRPYLELNDACRAILEVVYDRPLTGEIYNVASHNYRLKYIIDTIQKYVSVRYKLTSSEIMNQLSYNVSSEKFCDEFHFAFRGDLDKSVKDTLQLLGAI